MYAYGHDVVVGQRRAAAPRMRSVIACYGRYPAGVRSRSAATYVCVYSLVDASCVYMTLTSIQIDRSIDG